MQFKHSAEIVAETCPGRFKDILINMIILKFFLQKFFSQSDLGSHKKLFICKLCSSLTSRTLRIFPALRNLAKEHLYVLYLSIMENRYNTRNWRFHAAKMFSTTTTWVDRTVGPQQRQNKKSLNNFLCCYQSSMKTTTFLQGGEAIIKNTIYEHLFYI